MRIDAVRIENLRCIKDQSVNLADYTCFVGPNGAGKSTVLCALNIFFRNLENSPTDLATLAAEDFHLQDTSKPVVITVTFRDLSDSAQKELRDYVRHDRLIVSAEAKFDLASGRAEVRQYGRRLAMKEFRTFFERDNDGALVGELKGIFQELLKQYPDLAVLGSKLTKDGMRDALRQYEEKRPENCIEIKSADQFYGISGGKDRLGRYIQWVYVPAVKNVSDEQTGTKNGALGKLLARAVNAQIKFQQEIEQITKTARDAYQKMLDANQATLEEISASLGRRLAEWSHPDTSLRIEWEQDSNAAVRVQSPYAAVIAGEGNFEGQLARLGHGLQRSFLLALLQELASSNLSEGPTLVLGCEEPELYQHPPQARHLASVFEKLASESSQVLVTTHSPYFVTGENFESVRLVQRDSQTCSSFVRQYKVADLAKKFAELTGKPQKDLNATTAKLHQALQPALSEMFFTRKLVLVEGLEDVAYIQSWMVLSGRWDAYRKSGAHMVNVNGKSEFLRPAIIAKGLKIPLLVILDADGDKLLRKNKITGEQEVSPELTADHKRDNLAMLRLTGQDEAQIFPRPFSFRMAWSFGQPI